ncbi:hypothetical protein [Chelativorans sp. Marseille-P2723]|uniref:hypothetical protein n=1 Tax=Chelativorans sp. Marseille-P2723 TaxID=2709133 RepID=UPI0015700B4C|nr:hypothetical protein [Chelativorans sp. Marseille-P2723]
MVTFRLKATLFALTSALIISGCAGVAPRKAGPSLEGSWMDEQGVAISSFSNGQFVTVATDTGNRLSEGFYRFRDGQTIEISMRSLIRGTQTNVVCAAVTLSQLNCTNAEGQNFVLRRRT